MGQAPPPDRSPALRAACAALRGEERGGGHGAAPGQGCAVWGVLGNDNLLAWHPCFLCFWGWGSHFQTTKCFSRDIWHVEGSPNHGLLQPKKIPKADVLHRVWVGNHQKGSVLAHFASASSFNRYHGENMEGHSNLPCHLVFPQQSQDSRIMLGKEEEQEEGFVCQPLADQHCIVSDLNGSGT